LLCWTKIIVVRISTNSIIARTNTIGDLILGIANVDAAAIINAA